MEEITRRARAYLVHDAVNNMEGYITDYSPEALMTAQESGLLIIAEYNDGSRELVDASDVEEPQPEVNGVTLVQPSYVDDRMVAVADVFDALAFEMFGGVALKSMDAEGTAPPPTFAEALAKLKGLIANGNVQR